MKDAEELLKKDQFARYIGIELMEVSKGYAKASMKIEDKHKNGVGTVQGGAIFTLADFTFAAAANSHGRVAVAINANISYPKAATKGSLTAEAFETSLNPKIATYTVTVTDDTADTVARFEGLAYRKRKRVEELT
ncbi:MAG: acyl-CoA thioesterase [Methanohalophilus sp.]|nr:MAG: acyl-CoA thioesterase [Methanohalophilus sp.]